MSSAPKVVPNVSTPTPARRKARKGPRATAAEAAAGRAAQLRKYRGADAPETIEAERAQAAAQIENYVARIVDTFPKLTDQQVERITLLLRQTPAGDQ